MNRFLPLFGFCLLLLPVLASAAGTGQDTSNCMVMSSPRYCRDGIIMQPVCVQDPDGFYRTHTPNCPYEGTNVYPTGSSNYSAGGIYTYPSYYQSGYPSGYSANGYYNYTDPYVQGYYNQYPYTAQASSGYQSTSYGYQYQTNAYNPYGISPTDGRLRYPTTDGCSAYTCDWRTKPRTCANGIVMQPVCSRYSDGVCRSDTPACPETGKAISPTAAYSIAKNPAYCPSTYRLPQSPAPSCRYECTQSGNDICPSCGWICPQRDGTWRR